MRHHLQLGCGFQFTFRGARGESADLRDALSAWAMARAEPGAAMTAVLEELTRAVQTAPAAVRSVMQYCTAYRRAALLREATAEAARRASLRELQNEAMRHAVAERQRQLTEAAKTPPAPARPAARPTARVASRPVAPVTPAAAPRPVVRAPETPEKPAAGPLATPELAALKGLLEQAERARQRRERTCAYGARLQRRRAA